MHHISICLGPGRVTDLNSYKGKPIPEGKRQTRSATRQVQQEAAAAAAASNP